MITFVTKIKKILVSIITYKYFLYILFLLVLNVLVQKIFQYFLDSSIIHFFNIGKINISKYRIAESVILSLIDYVLFHIFVLNIKKQATYINKLKFNVSLKLHDDYLSSKLKLDIIVIFNNSFNVGFTTKTEYFGNYIDFCLKYKRFEKLTNDDIITIFFKNNTECMQYLDSDEKKYVIKKLRKSKLNEIL